MPILLITHLHNDKKLIDQAAIVLQAAGHQVLRDQLPLNLEEPWEGIIIRTEEQLANISDRSYLVMCVPAFSWQNWIGWQEILPASKRLAEKNIVIIPTLLLESQGEQWIRDLLDIIQFNELSYHFTNELCFDNVSEQDLIRQFKEMRKYEQKTLVSI